MTISSLFLKDKILNRFKQYGIFSAIKQIVKAMLRPFYRSSSDYIFILPDFNGHELKDITLGKVSVRRIKQGIAEGRLQPNEAETFLDFIESGCKGIYIEFQGVIAGYAWLRFSGVYSFGNTGKLIINDSFVIIKNVFVFPEFRGMGLNRKLNAGCLALIPKGKIPVIFIIPENRFAIRNSEIFGFQKVLLIKRWKWFFSSWKMRINRLSDIEHAKVLEKALIDGMAEHNMSTWKKEIICLFLRMTGIPWLFREFHARRKVTIINYHDPAPDVFEKHIRLFSRLYSFIHIDDVVAALEEKDFGKLPPKPLLVTLDDGHKGNAKLFEIIKKYNIPTVLYATAGVVNSNRHFWFKVDGLTPVDTLYLKTLDDKQRRQLLSEKYNHTDDKEYSEPHALSALELQMLNNAGVTIGSHTMFHPEVSKCSDEIGMHECCKSKEVLANIADCEIKHFAYPSGSYDTRSKEWLQKAGYKTARTIRPGRVTKKTNVFELPNFGISDDASVSKAIVQASGLWDMLKRAFPRGSV